MKQSKHVVDPRYPHYQSFLFRVWRLHADEPWRGSLHSTTTDQTCHFDTLDALFACLVEQLEMFRDADAAATPNHHAPEDMPGT